MADKTAQDATDTSVDESVDTSTDDVEEAMDDDTSFETEEDNQADESKEEESEDTSDFDEGADDVADKPEEKEEPEKPDESAEEETADEEAEDTAAEKPKKGEPDLDKAREAALERKIRKEEREKQEKLTLDRYLKEAKDDEDELARRQLQVESYNINKERAALNEEKLVSGVTKAKADIALLSSKDPVVQEELGNAIDDFEAMYVVKNKYGDIVEVKADVYQYLQRKAGSISKLTGIGARQESQNKAKQKSRTMTPPSTKPKEGKNDPEMDAFDEEANRW